MRCMFTLNENSKKVVWEITNRCNYLCKYCIFKSCNYQDTNELDTASCLKVIDELKENGWKELKITGGEPTLRKDIVDIIKYAKKKGLRVDMSTNASLIDQNIAKSLKESNIDMVHVSLDGFNKESNEIIRGDNTFDRTLKGIRLLKKEKLYIRIGTVIFKDNENNLEDIVKLVLKLHADEIIFSIMEPLGRMDNDYTYYKTKSIEEFTSSIEALRNKYENKITINYNWKENHSVKECPAGRKILYINNLGQISPCTWLVAKNKSLLSASTLKEKKLNDILKDLKKEAKNYECPCRL